MTPDQTDTIAAVATGAGGALAVVRVSGPRSAAIVDRIFTPVSGQSLSEAGGYTLHYGTVTDPDDRRAVDEVVASVFRAPRSYTGQDMVEISCHGSRYIQSEIMRLLIRGGARQAAAGEFTVRAFLAGKMDLSQAEAVADLIASTGGASHALAMGQMRGGYSGDLSRLRGELVELASLLELELDFGEEDVKFADRGRLAALMEKISAAITALERSFAVGNVLKEGVAVAIAGRPNAGKSTLLNALVRDRRALVSDIPGTTRDVVEESVWVGGVKFRFLDTAGIHPTQDPLESMGIDKARESIIKADIVLLVTEAGHDARDVANSVRGTATSLGLTDRQRLWVVVNKADKFPDVDMERLTTEVVHHLDKAAEHVIPVSARKGTGVDGLLELLGAGIDAAAAYRGDTVVSNARHYEALRLAGAALTRARDGMTAGITADLIVPDIREVAHHLGTITGEITTDEILGTIFSKFCIGK